MIRKTERRKLRHPVLLIERGNRVKTVDSKNMLIQYLPSWGQFMFSSALWVIINQVAD